jgi:hypothetical protein
VVEFTTGSRGKVPGKTCDKRIRNNNNKIIIIIKTTIIVFQIIWWRCRGIFSKSVAMSLITYL